MLGLYMCIEVPLNDDFFPRDRRAEWNDKTSTGTTAR